MNGDYMPTDREAMETAVRSAFEDAAKCTSIEGCRRYAEATRRLQVLKNEIVME